jgi:hypothetical protein
MKLITFMVTLGLFLPSCKDPAGDNAEALAALTRDSTRTGSANGTAFSGSYSVTFDQGRFVGPDCSAEFVLEYDLAINMGLPLEEVESIVREGYPPSQGTFDLVQEDGRLTIRDIGDDGDDVGGWIDEDGTFLVAELGEGIRGGDKATADAVLGAGLIVEGRISGEQISGELTEYVYNFDPGLEGSKGRCQYVAPFQGRTN